jgi:hypothetical protein
MYPSSEADSLLADQTNQSASVQSEHSSNFFKICF